MCKSPRRRFLLAVSALFARGASAAAAAPGEQPGRTFLQVMRYDRMPEKFFKPYFDAIDLLREEGTISSLATPSIRYGSRQASRFLSDCVSRSDQPSGG